MKTCTPAIFTAAIFTALFILDLIGKNYKDVGFHIAGGIFSVLGIYTACEIGGEMLAWILLGIPFIFLLIGLGMIWIDAQKQASPPVVVEQEPVQMNYCPCPYCHMCPCRCQQRCRQTTDTGSSADYFPTKPVKPSPPLGCPSKRA
jgi:hypothetical protein